MYFTNRSQNGAAALENSGYVLNWVNLKLPYNWAMPLLFLSLLFLQLPHIPLDAPHWSASSRMSRPGLSSPCSAPNIWNGVWHSAGSWCIFQLNKQGRQVYGEVIKSTGSGVTLPWCEFWPNFYSGNLHYLAFLIEPWFPHL